MRKERVSRETAGNVVASQEGRKIEGEECHGRAEADQGSKVSTLAEGPDGAAWTTRQEDRMASNSTTIMSGVARAFQRAATRPIWLRYKRERPRRVSRGSEEGVMAGALGSHGRSTRESWPEH